METENISQKIEEFEKIPWWNFVKKAERKEEIKRDIALQTKKCLDKMDHAETAEDYKVYSNALTGLVSDFDTLEKPKQYSNLVTTAVGSLIGTGMSITAIMFGTKAQNKMLDDGTSTKASEGMINKFINLSKK